jgi:hypothetical protein
MLQAGRSPVRVPDEVDFFNLRNPSGRTMALGSTQPLTEMSTRDLPGGKQGGRFVGLTTFPSSMSRMSENVEASTSRNPKGLHSLYGDNSTLHYSITLLFGHIMFSIELVNLYSKDSLYSFNYFIILVISFV